GAFIEMSNDLYNELNFSDVRSFVLLDQDSDVGDNEHLIGKYLGRDGIDYMNDFKAMRISEMYLIKAEAQARDDQFGAAAATIKELRDARFGVSVSLPSYGSRTEALTDILEERRIELAYEGHRYLDLKRFRLDLNEGFERDPMDCGGATPCGLGPTDYRFTLPLPQVEVDSNPNIPENNPGY
ncbi:MAG: RagB/SusD family nutrient uptake outer membrane protein, partial [Flavobacteriaceae bacterium]